MARLQFTLSCGDYDLTRGLIDGTTAIEGVDLTVIPLASPERHWRMTRHLAFDICELSLGSYLLGHAAGAPYVAIPAFPHRRFRHGYVFCNPDAGVRAAEDLAGSRVGLRTFQTTAGVWVRGILQHEYGVDLGAVTWVAQDEEDVPLGRHFRLRLNRVPAGDDIDAMLARGDLGAAIYPEVLPSVSAGRPSVRRLFEDYKAEEVRYFQKTGVFPIMHTVVIKRTLVERHPWLPQSTLKAFEASKQAAYRRLRNPRAVSLAWVLPMLEEQRAILGDDPWPYTLASNRTALETFARYMAEQGCIPAAPPVDALFAESTDDALPAYL